MSVGVLALVAIMTIALLVMLGLWRLSVREAYIRETLLPPGLLDTLSSPFPALSLKDRQLVARGLRKFFLAQLKAGRKPVAMPSRVVGALWTAFAQRGAAYESYCRQSLGRVLPVTAPVALSVEAAANAGLRRCWWNACREENLDPSAPTRIPLLFALDAKLKIEHGHYYFADDAARLRALRRDDGGEWSFERERSWTPDDLRDTAWDGGTDGFGDGGGGDGGGGDGGGGD
ncbi:MAG: hypothetical protein ING90_02480 [Rhodocyclaceae bacterium]|uniref:hypothetical protein n=1 Tax=Microcystis sp. M034S1 TaxID=2771111 RepID=UPI00258EC8BB|nr:hypothetical protein [Microcystis sp. M034S1]MCA3069311.1 hypothetical protein [Rhodocyclaceae bacterium]MCA2911435.1 hypothetical protein [Microcystis sp. M034S1]MCA3074077.1 hypothetical protein [Rhodocyclaceae bacterium]MCA3090745.1 hypothetical protein [Rhodocyclaceae bacterium]MCA3094971.1 hypothetical protein [Rhodocyclaceae bacterium]